MQRIFLFLITLGLIGAGMVYVGWGDASLAADDWPSRQALQQRYRTEPEVLLVYGTGVPAYQEAYQAYAAQLQGRSRRRQFRVQSDAETTRADLASAPLYLIGTRAANRWIDSLAADLPVSFTAAGFEVRGQVYTDSTDVFTLFYPNPVNPNNPLQVLTGNADEAVLAYGQRNRTRGDYEVRRNGQCILFGLFAQEANRRWRFDPAQHRTFDPHPDPVRETAHYTFYTHGAELSDGQWQTLSDEREAMAARLSAFLGRPLDLRVPYHLYGHMEDKGLMTGETRTGHADSAAVHVVWGEVLRGDDGRADAQWLLQQTLGPSAWPVLQDGLAMYFSTRWHGQGYAYWAARLQASGNSLSLADLTDPDRYTRESPLVRPAMTGTLVAYLIEAWGRAGFLERYPTWHPDPAAADTLQIGWGAYLDRLAQDHPRQPPAMTPLDAYQKGFNHAHEGYQIYNSYGSALSAQALDKLHGLGANAISLIPYTSMRDPKQPAWFRYSEGAGQESDEGVVQDLLAAKALGFTVMLKPQIWLSNGSWPGDIEMQSEADWATFFDRYHRWVRHYALLAEMYGFDVFCIATEMSKTVAGHEQEWLTLIQKVRGLYSGPLTVAANWDANFESADFWHALDFIGINAYRPLSDKENPTDAELEAGAMRVMDGFAEVAARYDLPILFTELGFTSTPTPWIKPYEYARGKPVNLQSQVRSYEAMFKALRNRPWCRGIYWWKWPSYLDDGGPQSAGFTPAGKPTEAVIAKWFSQPW